MVYPTTIDEVIAALDTIIASSLEKNSPAAIFAYVYRRTTAAIKEGIRAGIFNDNARMEQFDVQFANCYIKAYYDYTEGRDVSASWKISFDACADQMCIVQHITLGMNAHINLDLGVTAGTIMEGKQLADLKEDFMKVNAILFSLTTEMNQSLGRVSKLMFLASWLGKNNDELFINFSIGKARSFSWASANMVWEAADADDRQARIQGVDGTVAALGGFLRTPKGRILRIALGLMRRFEEKDVRKIIAGMQYHRR